MVGVEGGGVLAVVLGQVGSQDGLGMFAHFPIPSHPRPCDTLLQVL